MARSQRLKLALKFGVLSFVMDLFILWAPIGTLVASYVLGGGVQGAFVKALATTGAMALYRFCMNRWIYLRFQDSLRAHEAQVLQAARAAQQQQTSGSSDPQNISTAPPIQQQTRQKVKREVKKANNALEHLTMSEEKTALQFLGARMGRMGTLKGGRVAPLEAVKVTNMKILDDPPDYRNSTQILMNGVIEQPEEQGSELKDRRSPVDAQNTLQVPTLALKAQNQLQSTSNLVSTLTLSERKEEGPDLGTQIKLFMSFIYAGFYVVTATVLVTLSLPIKSKRQLKDL
ncbi:hypothetical protein HDV05_002176 [Chytridiales sp. JEL 0842]|nr:hypothetical protein HDV05_002176 [Chytridiales sp. JEL 0842]